MAKLAPSILSADFSELANQIKLTEEGGADYVHCDIMDGSYVPNITFGAPILRSLVGKTKLPFDVHLMIVHPELILSDFVTPQTEYIVVHQEACTHLHRVIQQIHSLGVKAGVAINPATPVSMIEPILSDVEMVLVMGVNPGFSGQSFIPYTVVKICELDELRKNNNLHFVIEMDGGASLENAEMLKNAGVDIIVAGSACFGADDIVKRCKDFKAIIE